MLIPREGYRFVNADFSGVEAIVLAHISGEKWIVDAYREGRDLHKATAARMFGVPEESIDKHTPEGNAIRQKGKVSNLALGYGGSVGALISMGASGMGIPEEELPELVRGYRSANKHIVRFWYACAEAAIEVVKQHKPVRVQLSETPFVFYLTKGMLAIRLPSGRSLHYPYPTVGKNRFGGDALMFKGVGLNNKWQTLSTFGGSIVESICQAYSRDLLANALKNVSEAGHRIVSHVHDEILVEDDYRLSAKDLCTLMCQLPDWAGNLPLKADGAESMYYCK
jgi:DNA polymerase